MEKTTEKRFYLFQGFWASGAGSECRFEDFATVKEAEQAAEKWLAEKTFKGVRIKVFLCETAQLVATVRLQRRAS